MENQDMIFITREQYLKNYYKNRTAVDPDYKNLRVQKNKENREKKKEQNLLLGIVPKKRGRPYKYLPSNIQIIETYNDK